MSHGNEVLAYARTHVTNPPQRYVLGAFVPKDAPNWRGPWDCAELASYDYYQVTGILFGTTSHGNPATADAWSGAWLSDAQRLGRLVPIEQAIRTPGAALLRVGLGAIGHVALSDGKGGTVEAYSRDRGVIAHVATGRRWTHGVLVPGVKYESGAFIPDWDHLVYRLTSPYMTGATIREIQERLQIRGYELGKVDGVFGPKTYAAVLQFQRDAGLLVDGEAGPMTLAALRI